ncbi:hypothetical protein BDV96DRAFT_647943 [Lophiotrema nucula]|uniref:Uncharacterized protein n=1 Tax=Lophiotrema nucula TaxID=690887 RepID=A0A6A5Z2M6_9PLEO|nr:hypothetical protein BDV96DRAFT_647943 [Lophiotrema nucula]
MPPKAQAQQAAQAQAPANLSAQAMQNAVNRALLQATNSNNPPDPTTAAIIQQLTNDAQNDPEVADVLRSVVRENTTTEQFNKFSEWVTRLRKQILRAEKASQAAGVAGGNQDNQDGHHDGSTSGVTGAA